MTDLKEKSAVNSRESLDRMLIDFYTLHGWDPMTGIPTKDLPAEIDLDLYFRKLGKAPGRDIRCS